ncbi:MAG: GtrA family protein [Steroidobacteraceae bacterium]|nr:GtrA family protein [Steroidobacteraceae bacterium]
MTELQLRSWFRELWGYGAASVVALATDMGLLALLVSAASVHYLAAATISFLTGGAVLYVLSVTLVFRFRRMENRTLEASVFLALGAVGLVVNASVMHVAVEVGHLHYMFAKLIAAAGTFGTNFVLRRHFLFSPVGRAETESD